MREEKEPKRPESTCYCHRSVLIPCHLTKCPRYWLGASKNNRTRIFSDHLNPISVLAEPFSPSLDRRPSDWSPSAIHNGPLVVSIMGGGLLLLWVGKATNHQRTPLFINSHKCDQHLPRLPNGHLCWFWRCLRPMVWTYQYRRLKLKVNEKKTAAKTTGSVDRRPAYIKTPIIVRNGSTMQAVLGDKKTNCI